jgi:cytochrome c peroxidase
MMGVSMLKVLITMIALATAHGSSVVLQPPLGLDLYLPVPESNPLSRAKVDLGRKLFFDKRLSRDRTVACASCHDPERAFSDGMPVARGIHNAEGKRNAPALINRGYGSSFFWDGRASSLERQAIEPILNPIELAMTEAELESRLGMKSTEITAALASYVRTIRSGNSPFDRYVAGKQNALNSTERAGLGLFRSKGRCVSCHVGPNFTDERFHNTGVAWREDRFADSGRFAVTHQERDRGAFKTPTLREISRTAPYMHDGSLKTLEDVVEFYSSGGRQNSNIDPELHPINFSAEEKQQLLAFLGTLTGTVRQGWQN